MAALLPVSDGGQEPSQPIENSKVVEVLEEPLPCSILVVDDQELIRDLLKDWLHAQGHEVLVASNGREALEIFTERGEDLDMVFLDMTMPEMSGIEVLEQIRTSNSTLPVFLSSGYLKQTAAPDLDRLGCSGFVQKPFSLEELRAIIADLSSSKE